MNATLLALSLWTLEGWLAGWMAGPGWLGWLPGLLVAWLAGWLAGWVACSQGWLAGCLAAWLACSPCATFFIDSSTKMDATMVAQEFLPRASRLAAWFLMSLINVALRALPELDQNENKKRKRSDWTRLTKSHENKRSGTSPSRPLFIQELAGRAPIVK